MPNRMALFLWRWSARPNPRSPALRQPIFLLPPAAVSDKDQRLEPEGILAAFGAVVSLDCSEIIPAMNAVRRFGCRTIAVLPRHGLVQSNLGSVLLNSFKAFQSVLIRSAESACSVAAVTFSRRLTSRRMNFAATRFATSRARPGSLSS